MLRINTRVSINTFFEAFIVMPARESMALMSPRAMREPAEIWDVSYLVTGLDPTGASSDAG